MKQKRSETKQILKEILGDIPQLERPLLSANQTNILELLSEQRKPMLAKTISARLLLDYNTTRARLSELMAMGYIYQPNKIEHLIASVGVNGICNVSSGKKCGYSILKLKN